MISFLRKKIITLLKKSEQITKTDMVYVAHGGFWSILEQGVGSLSSFFIIIVLTHTLPKDDFGQYRFILSLLPILTIFTLPEISVSLLRSVARGNLVDLGKMVNLKIRWGLLGALASLFLSLYYLYKGNEEFFYLLIITAAFIPFIESYYIYLAYYKGRQDFKTAAIYSSKSRIFQAILIVLVALLFQSLTAVIIAFLLGQLIFRYYYYRKTLEDIEMNYKAVNEQEIETNENVISYGKKLSLLSVLGAVRENFDKLIVWHFLGAVPLAIYYVALSIPNNLVLLFNVIPRIAYPKFSRLVWDRTQYSKVVYQTFLLMFVLLIPTAIYITLVPVTIPLLFSNYHDSVIPALIFSSIIFISPANAMIGQAFYAQKSVKRLGVVQIFGIMVFAIVFLLSYQSMGINGAALAFVLSNAVSLLTGVILLKFKSC